MSDSMERIPEKVTVLPATPEDAEAILRLEQESTTSVLSGALGVAPDEFDELFENSLSEASVLRYANALTSQRRESSFVAKAGGVLVGLIIVRRQANESGENEVVSFHVRHPGHGTGTLLWHMAEKTLDPTKDTFLWTTPGTPAVDVYRRLGFVEVARDTELLATKDYLERPRLKMVKKAPVEDDQR